MHRTGKQDHCQLIAHNMSLAAIFAPLHHDMRLNDAILLLHPVGCASQVRKRHNIRSCHDWAALAILRYVELELVCEIMFRREVDGQLCEVLVKTSHLPLPRAIVIIPGKDIGKDLPAARSVDWDRSGVVQTQAF